MNKWLKWLLRLSLTAAAMYLIFRKISWTETWAILRGSNLLWLAAAFILYNLSQVVSSGRLLLFYRVAGLHRLGRLTNLILYYQGMFYNLFLPGGIGGDGYKIHFLFKQFGTSVKKLFMATLLDRLNGLAALGFLVVLLAGCGVVPSDTFGFPGWLLIVAYALGTGICLALMKRFFPDYILILPKTTAFSFGVQALQLTAVVCILEALHITGFLPAYLLLFLVSSIAAVIPFTIGGAGARELVFVAGAPLLGVVAEQAVAVSLLFFMMTALSSLPGIFMAQPSKEAPGSTGQPTLPG